MERGRLANSLCSRSQVETELRLTKEINVLQRSASSEYIDKMHLDTKKSALDGYP